MSDPKSNQAKTENTDAQDAQVQDKAGKKSNQAKTATIEEVVVSIQRNELTKIPATVWAHEIPVLIQVHGEDHVVEVERYDVEVEGFSVTGEWERLKRKYNNKLTPQVVERAFPMGINQLADELGIALSSKEARAKAAASQQEGTARTTSRKVG